MTAMRTFNVSVHLGGAVAGGTGGGLDSAEPWAGGGVGDATGGIR